MRTSRLIVCVLAIASGLAAAAVLVPHAVQELHALRYRPFALPHATAPASGAPGSQVSHRPARPSSTAQTAPRARGPRPGQHGGSLWLLELVGLVMGIGFGLTVALALSLSVSRLRRRHTRTYELYEVHLSTHDQAKAQDLEDMVESLANIVRAWPAERARDGQPYVALELICAQTEAVGGGGEMEWSINVRCEPKAVVALDGAISAAYPDVRLGRLHGERPRPREGALREPLSLMRFCKERSFVYSLIADTERQASSPVEQIARAQIAQGTPSMVRFQLTPTPTSFEALARRRYRRHEYSLARHEGGGEREKGLFSTFDRAEMRAAERTQNRSLFWLETVVAADSGEVCKAVAAAVQSRRGENRLRRRLMVARLGLYRRRFPLALGPLVPSFRCLVSAAEVAHLLELPSARMKGVPVRRVTIPRIPAPPEVVRGSRPRPIGPFAGERDQAVATGSPASTNGAAVTNARAP